MSDTDSNGLLSALGAIIPASRLYADPVRVMAYASDASMFRSRARVVLDVENESEVRQVLEVAHRYGMGVTVRAAGTSLNGQAIGEGIVIRIKGKDFGRCTVLGHGQAVMAGCSAIGADVNIALAAYGRSMGPDPASLCAATMGGIVANNAAGMCCTVHQNTYATLEDMRCILADGTVVDTRDRERTGRFRKTHASLLDGLSVLRRELLAHPDQAERVRRKYGIKNTCGYAVNALVDFEDPLQILTHLMIGSEGTLGFVSNVTLSTLPVFPLRATSLMFFADLPTGAEAVTRLRKTGAVQAAEIMDRTTLRGVEHLAGAPEILSTLGANACGLLVETRAKTKEELRSHTMVILEAVRDLPSEYPYVFETEDEKCEALWNVRRGLFAAVTSNREPDELVLLEDINFPVDHLTGGIDALQRLFKKYGYTAGLQGHAFHGNLHFAMPVKMGDPAEKDRLHRFISEMMDIVALDFEGSLKAEHGTGRAVAPFVRTEWGDLVYGIMQKIKKLLDPDNILNPGVLLNDDPHCHTKGLKEPLAAHDRVDRCVECGFCEPVCPARNIGFTPRQRVMVWREIARLERDGRKKEAAVWKEGFYRYGEALCATDGLCTTRCPLGVDVAGFIRDIRGMQKSVMQRRAAGCVADHFATTMGSVRGILNVAGTAQSLVGDGVMYGLSKAAWNLTGKRLPLWNAAMPRGAKKLPVLPRRESGDVIVYFPSCAVRSMGDSVLHPEKPVIQVALTLLERAGYEVRFPDNLSELCCGKAFETKGLVYEADRKAAVLNKALLEVSEEGRYPVLCETSPCLARMQKTLDPVLTLMEPVEFARKYLQDRLVFKPLPRKIALHPTCSMRLMNLTHAFADLAGQCAEEVVIPTGIHCCGFSGDRGFSHPELNTAALDGLREQVADCSEGYSTSRTCEIGLTLHGEIGYKNIIYLLEESSR